MTKEAINELKKYTAGKKNTEKVEISILTLNRLLFALKEQELCEDCTCRMEEILDVIHKTIYQFFDVCGDDEEVSISDKDKLLLEVNKAICNNLKALEQEPCEDCRTCNKWSECECGEKGHRNNTSIGYSAGGCKDYEPCDDCISRQAALASIKALYPDIPIVNIMGARRKWLEKYAPYFECENAIEYLPPVTPKQKMRHWITTRTIMHDGEYYCDKCGCDSSNNKKWTRCPNCGVKMAESEDV